MRGQLLRRCGVLALAMLGVAGGVLASAAAKEPVRATTASVRIDATSYQPSTIVVRLGDSIEWSNHDLFRHTVTSPNGAFDSKDIQPEASWKLTPRKVGRYDYACIYHGTMTGTIVVR